MNKNRYLLLIISFIFTMFICSNVFAKDYGYYMCANGHEWTPEQDCRIRDGKDSTGSPSNKPDGELEDGAYPVEGALTINIDSNGNVTGVATDLFNLTGATWEKDETLPGVFVASPGVFSSSTTTYVDNCSNPIKFVKNWDLCIQEGLNLKQSQSIINKAIYYHDYSAIEHYYKTTGKLPKVIVAEKVTDSFQLFDGIWSKKLYYYVYYPSDLMTSDIGNFELSLFSPRTVILNLLSSKRHDGLFGFANGFTAVVMAIAPQLQVLMPAGAAYREVKYFSSDLSSTASLNSCDDLENELAIYGQMLNDYGDKDNRTLEQEESIRNSCNAYISKEHKTSYSDCYKICNDINRKLIEAGSGSYKKTNECGFGEDMVAWIIRILKIVRFIVPVLVIVLSIVDYIAAISSADDDAIKKAGNRFSKRLLIMILIFLLPSLIQFILGIFNVPGFSSSNPYCLK